MVPASSAQASSNGPKTSDETAAPMPTVESVPTSNGVNNDDDLNSDGQNNNEDAAAEEFEGDNDDPQTLLKPAFPDGRRVSYGQTQCCNGFNHSGVCAII